MLLLFCIPEVGLPLTFSCYEPSLIFPRSLYLLECTMQARYWQYNNNTIFRMGEPFCEKLYIFKTWKKCSLNISIVALKCSCFMRTTNAFMTQCWTAWIQVLITMLDLIEKTKLLNVSYRCDLQLSIFFFIRPGSFACLTFLEPAQIISKHTGW